MALAAWRFVVAGHLMSASPGAPPPLGPLDVLSLLLAALCHDLEHPGTTNAFQVNTGSVLAQRYNDASVLENHHCAVGLAMLDASGILSSLSPEDKKTLRKSMIGAILATDVRSLVMHIAAVVCTRLTRALSIPLLADVESQRVARACGRQGQGCARAGGGARS